MITTAIVYDHRQRGGVNDERPVEVRVTVDRKPYYINTGVRVRPREFKYGEVCGRVDAYELNERIHALMRNVEHEVAECVRLKSPIDVAEIRRKVYGLPKHDDVSMIQWIEEEIPNLNITEATRYHYFTLLMRLKEYGKMRRFGDLTVKALYDWDAWLHRLEKPMSKAKKQMKAAQIFINQSTVYNYHKDFRALLYRAEKFGLIDSNPYGRVKGAFKRDNTEKIAYLTEDEMQRIIDMPMKDGSPVAIARDLFVFQMFTGLSYSDMQAFDIRDYHIEDGVYTFNGARIKTGVPYVSHLLNPSVEVLKKYGMQIPKMVNSKYNQNLKAIGMVAGLNIELHSHVARHTFATWMLRNGVKVENLAKMLGHSDIRTTQHYARVLAKSVHEEFDRVAALMAAKEKEKKEKKRQ